MIRVFISFVLVVILVAMLSSVAINMYSNTPNYIERNLNVIDDVSRFKNHGDWLWCSGRSFVFDIIYMNIFSPGAANLYIKEEEQSSTFTITVEIELNDYFKRLYDAKMLICSTVDKANKLSLLYKEVSHTPEKDDSKEIVFNPATNIAQRQGIKFRIPDYTYDPLAAFFNLLDSDFEIDKEITLNTLSKEEIYELKATPVEFKDNIYKLEGEAHRQDKSSSHGARFTIWIKNGQVRVPLLMKVITAAGPIYLRPKEVR